MQVAYKVLHRNHLGELWSYIKSEGDYWFGIQYSETDWTVAPFGGLFVFDTSYNADDFISNMPNDQIIEKWTVEVDKLTSINKCMTINSSSAPYQAFWENHDKYKLNRIFSMDVPKGTYLCNKLRLLKNY